ncbi:uncharacterized protein K489DRAFT_380446 [Dissoconium aciculare CBS 342.82]|uniref:LITAF domain-containing protein n=1 Tax=Dissoconium aciculare CBS 342.82 TaxID=1314786 RepID=A0A6J3M4U6_9PEZI|nr:uncharacterized protein K489DRAFT_380446 [Dissoconium aciculare CBS 342.82]KAF1823055.1 hypothetical protein K489DRAFT_380446 [Dissoconium aciculare CBS 342.82]
MAVDQNFAEMSVNPSGGDGSSPPPYSGPMADPTQAASRAIADDSITTVVSDTTIETISDAPKSDTEPMQYSRQKTPSTANPEIIKPKPVLTKIGVVTPLQDLRSEPALINCPFCEAVTTTKVHHKWTAETM